MFVCSPLGLLIIRGMIWTSYDWLNKLYNCYMATVVIIGDGHALSVEECHTNLPNKSKLYHCISYYFHFNIPFKQSAQCINNMASETKCCNREKHYTTS